MDSNRLDPKGVDYKRLLTSLQGMGLVTSTMPQIVMLTGGVSSLIILVEDEGTKFCAKSALARLKVAMEWLDPADHPVWKQQLLDGNVSIETARQMGDVLGQIHSKTAGDKALAAQFPNDADFDALRLDPFLRATAAAYPDLADRLLAILDTTAGNRHALIHGDVSPKNILDAECATYGDPAFDVAFCLNHLILKAVHMPAHANALAVSFTAFVQAYVPYVTWEAAADLEARTAALLPALALARVDGKSPVEYLTAPTQQKVRDITRDLIISPANQLDQLLTLWMETLT